VNLFNWKSFFYQKKIYETKQSRDETFHKYFDETFSNLKAKIVSVQLGNKKIYKENRFKKL